MDLMFRRKLKIYLKFAYFTLKNLKTHLLYSVEREVKVDYKNSNGETKKLFVFKSDARSKSLLAGRMVENLEKKIFSSYIKDFDVLIDVGANYGEFLLERESEGKLLYLFEPNKKVSKALTKTIRANGYSNVKLITKALSDSAREALFYVNIAWSGASTLSGLRIKQHWKELGLFFLKKIKVETTSLDKELISLADKSVLMKIDCEGHDLIVLDSSIEALEKASKFAIIIELNKEQVCSASKSVLKFIDEKTQNWIFIYQNQAYQVQNTESDFFDEIMMHFASAPGQIDCVLHSN
jgi:FkbM family methyltransferase